MSLINGSLQIGSSALQASQAAMQVIGNNVANASTAGYSLRQATIVPAVENGSELGSGAQFSGVQRMTDEAVNAQLRGANSDLSAAQSAQNVFSQLQTTFNALGDSNLSTQMTAFFNALSDVANNPEDSPTRTLALQAGQSLAQQINATDQSIQNQRDQINSQLGTMTAQVNQLTSQVASLNDQITEATAGNGDVAGLQDQRDADLTQLSQLVNVQTLTNSNGSVNVYVNSSPLVQGTQAFALTDGPDPNSAQGDQIVQYGPTGQTLAITGGSIGGLLSARSQGLDYAQTSLDTLANTLINQVNIVQSQGQGLDPLTSVTSTQAVSDPTASLTQAGLGLAPVNGTFQINVTDPSGETTTQTVAVQVGVAGNDSLDTLAQKISSIPDVSATVLPTGQLSITAASGYSISFGQDSSHVLAALGINTFFTGANAADMAVNSALTSSGIAAALDNSPGDNSNAINLAAVANQSLDALGGTTLATYFTNTMSTLATSASQVNSNQTQASTLQQALTSQQQAVSGVNTDEETVSLMQYQQGYEAAAHYISVINQLLTDMINVVGGSI